MSKNMFFKIIMLSSAYSIFPYAMDILFLWQNPFMFVYKVTYSEKENRLPNFNTLFKGNAYFTTLSMASSGSLYHMKWPCPCDHLEEHTVLVSSVHAVSVVYRGHLSVHMHRTHIRPQQQQTKTHTPKKTHTQTNNLPQSPVVLARRQKWRQKNRY